jgi:hypothetical protein
MQGDYIEPNKAFQSDNLQAARFAVSLSLNFTAKRPAYKLRLKAALAVRSNYEA